MAEARRSPDGMCDVCGKDVNRLGTRMDLEVIAGDYRHVGYPAFCSWEHCAEWFARPIPDFTTWEHGPASEPEGFQYGGLVVVVAVLALSVIGLVSLVKAIA